MFLSLGTFSPCVTWYTCVCPYCGGPTLFQAYSRCLVHAQRMSERNVRTMEGGGWVHPCAAGVEPVPVILPIYPSACTAPAETAPHRARCFLSISCPQHRSGLQGNQQPAWPSAVRLDSDLLGLHSWPGGVDMLYVVLDLPVVPLWKSCSSIVRLPDGMVFSLGLYLLKDFPSVTKPQGDNFSL